MPMVNQRNKLNKDEHKGVNAGTYHTGIGGLYVFAEI